MAFMLGSLTNGMFGAFNDVMSAGQKYQEYKATKAMQDAAEKTSNNISKTSQGGALPGVTAGGSSGGSMDKHDPDANLPKINLDKDVPQPKHLSFGPSAREHDNSPVSAATPMQKPDTSAMPGESTPPPTAPKLNTGALPVTAVGGGNAQPSNEFTGGGYNPGTGTWQGAPTGTPVVRQAAPTYLPQTRPSAANPSGNQPQTGFHAVFGANQAPGSQGVPTHQPVGSTPMPGGPGTASPQMAAMGQAQPSLANGQSGLGAQLMASMNPQSGATA